MARRLCIVHHAPGGQGHDSRQPSVALLSGRHVACRLQAKQRTLWSSYFEVGGYDWRLLVYPSGDSQALPGYISLYVQASPCACHILMQTE